MPTEHRLDALISAGMLMALGTLQSVGRTGQSQELRTGTWCMMCGLSLALASLGSWHENAAVRLAAGVILALYGGWTGLSFRTTGNDPQASAQSDSTDEATP